MVVCLAYRHSLGIIILVAMKEKGLPFTVTLVLLRSRTGIFFLTPVLFFIKEVAEHK